MVSDEAAAVAPIYKFKIVCGCGFYTTNNLADWDSHLAELVAMDDGNNSTSEFKKLHVDRTTVQLVQINAVTQ